MGGGGRAISEHILNPAPATTNLSSLLMSTAPGRATMSADSSCLIKGANFLKRPPMHLTAVRTWLVEEGESVRYGQAEGREEGQAHNALLKLAQADILCDGKNIKAHLNGYHGRPSHKY